MVDSPADPVPPAQLEPYVRILGTDDAVTFLLRFGGAELYLAIEPRRSALVEVLGAEKAAALAREDSMRGLPKRVPLGKPWVAQVLAARGLSKADIARKMHTTDVTVRKYLREADVPSVDDPRQPRLF